MDIPFLSYLPSDANIVRDSYNLIIDALFGFSFKGPARPDFATIIKTLMDTNLPIVSIDVPSGGYINYILCQKRISKVGFVHRRTTNYQKKKQKTKKQQQQKNNKKHHYI